MKRGAKTDYVMNALFADNETPYLFLRFLSYVVLRGDVFGSDVN